MLYPKIKLSDTLSIVSILIALGSAYFTYKTGFAVQDRQSSVEQLRSLNDSTQRLLEVGGTFISAITANQDIKVPREKLRVILAQEAFAAANTQRDLPSADVSYVDDYTNSLKDLSKISQGTNSVVEMRPWVEAFGRVLDTKSALSQALLANIKRKG